MSLLLDTCAAIWWWQDSPRLSAEAAQWMADSRHVIYFSSASAMEIATKVRLGKLQLSGQLARDLGGAVAKSGWKELPLGITAAHSAGMMDWSHRDPFDRLLAAQAMQHQFTLITCDPVFATLGELKRFW